MTAPPTTAPRCTAYGVYVSPGHLSRSYPVLPGTEPERVLTLDGRTYELLMVVRDEPPRDLTQAVAP